MNLTTLFRGKTWMTVEESGLAKEFVTGLGKLLQRRGVVDNPLLVLRVDDVLVSWLLTRRLESGLAIPAEDDGPQPAITPAQVESIGKHRERLRKSVKELEDYCDRAGTPIDTGLADVMKPVIQQVQGKQPFFETIGETVGRASTS